MKRASILLFLLWPTIPVSYGASMNFGEVWQRFTDNSLEMASVKSEKEASEIALKRGELHWLPKLSLMGQWFNTNDPGQVLINQLGQRSMTPADFTPSTLNHPDRKQFTNAMINLNFPVYEGGLKENQLSVLKTLDKSINMELEAKKTENYAELTRQYGSLLIFQQNLLSLKELKKELDRIVSYYQMGAVSNPVGRMGLLGLQGVSNRMESMLITIEQQSKNHKSWISNKAELNEDWELKENNIDNYINEYLLADSTSDFSTQIKTQELKVSALDYTPDMEKARYRPRVGLFGQNQIYSGDRSTENAQTFGIYLQWELFNVDSYNRTSEARVRAIAAQEKLRFAKQEETIARSKLFSTKETLETNLKLIKESSKLLNEQAKNSIKLFRSGLMNGLQLAEVINRRVDVIEQKNTVELQYLDVRSRLYQLGH